MKRIVLLFSFFTSFATNTSFSQAKLNVDSLTNVLNKHAKDDTAKVKILIALSDVLIKVDYKEGISYSEKALVILEKINAPELKANALHAKARHLESIGQYAEAIDLEQKALVIYNQLNNIKKTASVHTLLSTIYHDKSDAVNAKKHYEIALTLCEQIDNEKGKGRNFYAMGNILNSLLDDYKQAITYYEKALSIAQEINDKNAVARAFTGLGSAYYKLGDYVKAIEYTQKGLRINENAGNTYTMTSDYLNLGNIYMKLPEVDKALDYFNKALTIANKTGNARLKATIYDKIGLCYKELKQYEKAIVSIEKSIVTYKSLDQNDQAYSQLLDLGTVYADLGRKVEAHRCYQEALAADRKSGNQPGISAALINIGQLYAEESDSFLLKIGVSSSERYTKALTLVNEALEIGVKINQPRRKIKALETLSFIYEKNKDYVKSYNAYKKYIALKDSVFGDEVKKQITRKDMQYDYDKKETAMKYEQQLTADQLEKQKLLTIQQGQSLTLKEQALALSNKDLLLSNNEKDLVRLAYLKEQAEKQEKTDQLFLSIEREKGKNLELTAKQQQNLYLGLLSVVLLAGLGTSLFFYNKLNKKNKIIAQQNELNEHTIAILSHDIKEPLLGVKLLLKKINKDDPFVAQASHSLENQINAVNGILNNLLKVRKLALHKLNQKATANVQDVVQNVAQQLNFSIQSKNITIENDIDEKLSLPINAEKLQIIVHNLLSNAVKYSFQDQIIKIYAAKNGFFIQDFGVGLSEEQRSKLMREVTASQQGTKQERGNGMGLFLVGAMLKGEKIRLNFESPDSGGTIVKVSSTGFNSKHHK
jgi:tetratricopeptide (TPR) repeat protein